MVYTSRNSSLICEQPSHIPLPSLCVPPTCSSQIEELLKEVRVNFDKQKFLEQTLHTLKGILDAVPDSKAEKEVRRDTKSGQGIFGVAIRAVGRVVLWTGLSWVRSVCDVPRCTRAEAYSLMLALRRIRHTHAHTHFHTHAPTQVHKDTRTLRESERGLCQGADPHSGFEAPPREREMFGLRIGEREREREKHTNTRTHTNLRARTDDGQQHQGGAHPVPGPRAPARQVPLRLARVRQPGGLLPAEGGGQTHLKRGCRSGDASGACVCLRRVGARWCV